MAKKETAEYVFVKEYADIISNLNAASVDMQQGINRVFETSNLNAQKHIEVQRCIDLVKALSKELNEVKRLMPIKGFRKPISIAKARAKPKPFISTEAKPEISEEFVARSEKALQHLERNLAELKAELGKVR
ncbi:MAG: hypothetical protein QW063_02980 [Candidatus Nanoarchaeia archaeon]